VGGPHVLIQSKPELPGPAKNTYDRCPRPFGH
jgi:hypothetical protein